MMCLAKAPLFATAQALRSGTREVREYLNELCDRIEANEPAIQAFVPEENRRERLVKEADDLNDRFPDPHYRPPLYGIPVGVKDIFRADGFPTQAGSKLPPFLFEGREAVCVSLLKEAGALIAGKTVTTEFAYFEPGPTRNPYNTEHTPGGSSSGSAAGVAGGFFPLAIGTQTIGSVIRPAAFCGILGFKPSFGRIPTEGVLMFSPSADHIGLFTQDIEGMELAASIVCKEWNSKCSSEATPFPVLGVPEGQYLEQAAQQGFNAFERQVRHLDQAGYTVKRVPMFDDIEAITLRHKQMVAAEFAKEHADWFDQYCDLYRPRTIQLLLNGRQVSGEALETARSGRLALRKQLEDVMQAEEIDIWISPAAKGEAPRGIHATGDPIMNLPWTYAGLPTLTILAGFSEHGLPFGLQCSAACMQDEQLLAWGKELFEVFALTA